MIFFKECIFGVDLVLFQQEKCLLRWVPNVRKMFYESKRHSKVSVASLWQVQPCQTKIALLEMTKPTLGIQEKLLKLICISKDLSKMHLLRRFVFAPARKVFVPHRILPSINLNIALLVPTATLLPLEVSGQSLVMATLTGYNLVRIAQKVPTLVTYLQTCTWPQKVGAMIQSVLWVYFYCYVLLFCGLFWLYMKVKDHL